MVHFYRRPQSSEELEAMIAFHKREQEIDAENALMYAQINKGHLNKTRLKQGESMVKRWAKESSAALKVLTSQDVKIYQYNKPRTWVFKYAS